MIKEITMYTVICDGCSADVFEDEEYAAWNDTSAVEDIADDSDWLKIEDKHYCPKCYTHDEGGNPIVI